MNYTVNNDYEINKIISSNLQYIVNEILSVIDPKIIKAITLSGSFGRGEGGVIKEENSFLFVNDFDLNVFLKDSTSISKINHLNKLHKVAENCAKNINIKQIDINTGNYIKFFIRHLKWFFTVNAYEFIHGHQILYGNLRLKFLKPFFKQNKIPLLEGLKFYYTRGMGLLLPLLMQKTGIDKIGRLNQFIEINKARLAIGDSYLIANQCYTFSYQKRIEIALNLSFDDIHKNCESDSLKSNYIAALHWKIKPDNNFSSDLKSIIIDTKIIFLNALLWFESNRTNNNFSNIMDYISFLKAYDRKITNRFTHNDYFIEKLLNVIILLNFSHLKDIPDKFLHLFSTPREKSIKDKSWINSTRVFLKHTHPEGIIKTL